MFNRWGLDKNRTVNEKKKKLVVTGKSKALIAVMKKKNYGSWVDELAKCFRIHCVTQSPSVRVSVCIVLWWAPGIQGSLCLERSRTSGHKEMGGNRTETKLLVQTAEEQRGRDCQLLRGQWRVVHRTDNSVLACKGVMVLRLGTGSQVG